MTASFTVANTGGCAAAEVVPVYVHQPVSDVVAPDQRLVGFARVSLDAGKSRQVSVAFPVSRLAVTSGDIDAAGRRAVEPGAYQVQVEDLTSRSAADPTGAWGAGVAGAPRSLC